MYFRFIFYKKFNLIKYVSSKRKEKEETYSYSRRK